MIVSKYKYLFQKGGISFLFRILGMFLTFIVIKLISNIYSIEIYGGFSILQTVSLVLLLTFSLGFQNTLVIEHGKYNLSNKDLNALVLKCFKIILFVSIFPILFLIFGAGYLSELFNNILLKNSFIILGCFLPILVFHDLYVYFYIATQNFLKFGIFFFVLPNLFFLFFILLFYKNYSSLFYLTLFYCLSFTITFIIEIFLSFKSYFPSPNFKVDYKSIILISLPMMFSGLTQLLLNWTDVFMLGNMVTNEEVGKYNVAFKLGSLMLIVLATVSTIILPKLSDYFNSGDIISLEKIIKQSTKFGLFLSTPLLIIIILLGKNLLSFFGEVYIESYKIMIVISLTGYFGVFCGNIDQILNMSNNRKALLYINLFSLLFNIILNLYFIPMYGSLGAAFATLITTVIMKISCVILIKRKLGFYTLGF